MELDLASPLGRGTDGSVWTSNNDSAVKALERQKNYRTELECYQRFKNRRIKSILGFSVPELIGWNDDLWIIEMRIVTPPFILDFAKSYLDQPADYSAVTMAEWDEEGQERFEGRWPRVRSLLSALESFGIYYYDAKPANIMFKDLQ